MNAKVGLLTLAIVIGFAAHPGHAESYFDQLADGNDWTATMPNGQEMTMRLDPDGTGQMRFGLLRRSVSWRAEGDAICLDGTPNGEQCIAFRPTGDGGFTGQGPDGNQMVLRR